VKYAQPNKSPRSPKASGIASETTSIAAIAPNIARRFAFWSGSIAFVSQP
jgi:hypothetical protein